MELTVEEDKNSKRKGIIGAIVVHLVLALLFLWLGLPVPDPPLKEPMVEIEFGDMGAPSQGGGKNTPQETEEDSAEPEETPQEDIPEPVEEPVETPAPEETVPEEVEVQEEESVDIPPPPKEKKKEEVKKAEKKQEKVEVKKEEVKKEEKKEPERVVDKTKLFSSKNTKGTSSSGGPGTLGGKGKGEGKGEGEGKGDMGNGNWSLAGRSLLNGPKIGEDPQEEGTVVIKIWVDRNGQVIRTQQDLLGSNTNNQKLIALAKKAAMEVKFNANPEAAAEQRGSMTFKFILK